ncbi:MAG TPA: hypothetical protein VFH56_01545, partial [Acidimicrobiales bacterium]|nr:hypothetical protein [Acidimicrobiales bacterium]
MNTLPGHDLGAHEDIDPAQVAERMRAHMHDSVLREDYTSPRVHRDKAMRVREERPTGFLTGQSQVTGAVPVQVAYARRERLSLTVVNMGSSTVYIGSTQATAQPASGFPIPANSA